MYSFFSTPRVAQRRLQVVACGVALAWAATTAVAAPFGFSPAQATGSDIGFSLRTTLSLASEDLGKPIHVFVVAHVPDGASGKWYAKGPQGWVVVSGVGVPTFQTQASADASISLDLAQSEDARGLAGTVLYVGYGVQTAQIVTAEDAFAEMVRSARYRAVYTFVHNSSAAWSLQAATEQSLKAHFQEVLGEAGSKYLATPWALDFMGVSTATTSPSPVASPGAAVPVSGTTLQEAGVDEADRIKTDGQYVFSLGAAEAIKGGAVRAGSDVLVRNKLQASSAQSALPEVDRLSVGFSKDVEATGLYRDTAGQQVAVIGEAAARWGIYDAWFAPQAWTQGVTELALVDTSNPTRMGTTRKLRMNAALIGSRRLGNTLYLVLRSAAQVPGIDPWWPKEKTQSNQRLLDALQVAAVLPTVSVNGGTASALVDAASCFTQPSNAAKTADIISVMAIDLAATVHRHAARCFTGGTEAFYMSEQSLYLATTRSAYAYGNRFPIYAQQSSTDVHKFALNGLDMSYRGSGNVTGHLGFDQNRKSFRLGEHQGTLRVITQSTTSWGGWGIMPAVVPGPTPTPTPSPTPVPENSPGHLSMLQESKGSLVVVGELPNTRRPAPLGKPNEQLYASRFLGNRGYLVTYRLTDPLYVLDLSNPTDPFIAGELEVSGYSDYLFPLSETLLLGVGKEAIEESNGGDGRFAWYQGVKLSLIDLTNPAKPREAAKSVIGRRGTDATVLRDHHGISLATNGNSVRVSLPVSLHETATTPVSTAANAYFQFTRNELQKFDIDIGQATLRARTALPSGVPGQRDIGRDRSLLWGDQVHYYQDGVWTSGLW